MTATWNPQQFRSPHESQHRRLLIVHDEREQLGGAETYLRELTAALERQGCEVAWAHSHIPQAVRMFRPDFVIAETVIVKVGLGALEWLQWRKIPHALVLVDYWPVCKQRNLVRLPEAVVCESCDGKCQSGLQHPGVVNTVNRSTVIALNPRQQAINSRLRIRTDAWIPCGLDTDFWAPPPERSAGVRILTSTAWGESTYGQIPWKGAQFIRQIEHDLAIPVHQITGVPRWAVRDALQGGHIFVFPSVWDESWGYCLLEAMACGLACVAFDIAGPATMLDSSCGVIVPRGDGAAMVEAVRGLLADPERRERLGRAAAERVRVRYSLACLGAEWIRLIDAILAREVA